MGKKLDDILSVKDWDIIGFSILEETLISDIKNMQIAEKTNPNALMIAGGIEAQFNYQTILDKSCYKKDLIFFQ